MHSVSLCSHSHFVIFWGESYLQKRHIKLQLITVASSLIKYIIRAGPEPHCPGSMHRSTCYTANLCTFTGHIFFLEPVPTDWALRLLAASTFLAVSRATHQAIYLPCWFACPFVSYLSQITHTSSRSALSFITLWMHSSSDRWSSAEVFWGARQVGELINKRKQQERGWEKKEESVEKHGLKKWDQPRSWGSWVDVCFLGF